jgi:hypothetical protein
MGKPRRSQNQARSLNKPVHYNDFCTNCGARRTGLDQLSPFIPEFFVAFLFGIAIALLRNVILGHGVHD